MVQNPKGGGLDSSFGGGGSQLGGVQSTNKFLDKTTWTLAISLFALILLSNVVINRGGTGESKLNTDGIEIPAVETEEAPASSTTDTPAETGTTEKTDDKE